ncbi:hypothetical protein [Kribbella sindirgiensis]|uniref:Peptidase inhibitor family I36 protein n=1 Tax=Kribbella sindirgiensis TaxID=1124744 RepID=A0A4R0IP37_9ACTN|nr:hypothetical protein [Kribbella sindirgiensis]TCC30455.1 hypothetical protein E0H50_23895 [Kribbella sindirgiensis]
MRSRTMARLWVGLTALAVSASGALMANAAPPDERTTSQQARFATQARSAGLTAAQAKELQRKVDDRMAQIKVPVHQVSFNQIMADDGSARLTLGAPGAAAPRNILCDDGNLCLWAGDYYDHERHDLFYCRLYNLADWGFNDRLTSYMNEQSKGTRARFYNWQGGKWVQKFTSVAPHQDPDLGRWQGLNNMIDAVRPC